MSRIIRTILFMFFLAVFIVAAPSLVLYAQGWRLNLPLDPSKKLIVKTGGIFVKVYPKQAGVYVNDELVKQTDFFFDSALVENLLPRQYKIQIKKNNYQTWEKTLEVKEQEVVQARNVILFPNQIEFLDIAKNIDGVLLSPDKQKIALREINSGGWNLKLYDIEKNITIQLADQNLSGKPSTFSGWEWSNGKALDVVVNSNNTNSTYSIDVDKNPPHIAKKTVAGTVFPIPTTNGDKNNENKYYLGEDGFVYKKDSSGNPVKVGGAQISFNANAKRQLWAFGNYFFARIGNELYVADASLESFKKIFDGLTADPTISPDGKKVVYQSNSEIWVFFLVDKTDSPTAAAGDRIFIARFSEKITDCEWFNSDYLTFGVGNEIKAAEIDNRAKINIANLANITKITGEEQNEEPQIFFDPTKKTIYLFSGNTLYKSNPIE